MYAGLAPQDALALYGVITYMDSVEGVFVPDNGMHQMATGLAEALRPCARLTPRRTGKRPTMRSLLQLTLDLFAEAMAPARFIDNQPLDQQNIAEAATETVAKKPSASAT